MIMDNKKNKNFKYEPDIIPAKRQVNQIPGYTYSSNGFSQGYCNYSNFRSGPNALQPVTNILNKSEDLRRLITIAKQIKNLDLEVKQHLESDHKKNCRVVDYQQGTMVLVTHSNAWATELRFSAPDILEQLRKQPKWASL